MYKRLLSYLESNNILVDNQFGFREDRSYMALLKMINDITYELDNKNDSMEIFIDLWKAFDTTDHKFLKIISLWYQGTVLQWSTNYLANCTQYVSLNNINSESLPIKCGDPQGSILGLLLFLIFINDITNVSRLTEFVMFADDTNIFFKHENLQILYEIVNAELVKI